MMLSKEDRHAYYTFGINDITYEINMHHTTEALQKANAMLKEMTENHDGHFDMIYNVIGTIYQDRGNYKMAKMYMQKAIDQVQPTDSAGMVGAYIGMANLESSVNPDKAIALADTILPYCRKYPTHYAYALIAKAQSYFFKNDSRMFFDIYEQYVVYKRENRLQDTQSDDIMATLKSAFDGNYQEALDHINNDSLYTENIGRYDLRIQLFEMMGNKDMVIAEQQKKLNAIDSLNSNFIYENLNRMNAEMDVAKTQQKAERARVYWLIAVVLLLVVIIGLMFWRYLTRRHFQKELMLRNQELEVALLRAEEADRMQTSFIKHVSHEIRTPLNVITGFAQIITNPQYEFDEAERNRMLQDISRNTMEITNIVNELLEIAQDESRQHYDKIDVVNINNACKKIIADMQPYNTRNLNIDFITDLTDDFTIHTNKQALQRIITQLMDNALKFTEKGNIELYVHDTPDHGTIRFIITDTGIGIEEKNQNHVFDKFFKADSFKQGFGLGLTISRKMAVLLGGSLNLDKTYTDGARFILSLPTS
jgi:signal transduction histidine kinase